MKRVELLKVIALGEDSRRQFKADVTNADSLAADLVAFSNSSGGVMFIGVRDDGTVRGLNRDDVRRINQLIANAAHPESCFPDNRKRAGCKPGCGHCSHGSGGPRQTVL